MQVEEPHTFLYYVNYYANYCFNPRSKDHHALEKIKDCGWFNATCIVAITAFVSIISLGLGTIGTFRFLTKTFSQKKVLSEEDKTTQAVWTLTAPNKLDKKTPQVVIGERGIPKSIIKETPEAEEAKKTLLENFFKDFAPYTEANSLQLSRFCQAAYLDDIKKIAKKETLDKTNQYLASFPGKEFSKETKRHLAFLIGYLSIHPDLGFELGKADETGDCFFHSIAQQLSVTQKQSITTKMVRQAIADYVGKATKNELEELRKDIKENHEISIEDYKKQIPFTVEDIPRKKDIESKISAIDTKLRQNLSKEEREKLFNERMAHIVESNAIPAAPLWGCWEVEAKIVSRIYNCQIKALSLDSLISNKDNQRLGPFIRLLDDGKKPVLYIAQYGGELRSHFVPLTEVKTTAPIEKKSAAPAAPTSATVQDSPKVKNLKEKHKQQLAEFETWAKERNWEKIHTAHYDWWMFPITRKSNSYGDTYAFSDEELSSLKKDPSFMQDFRRGVELVMLSCGWDVKANKVVDNPASWQSWQSNEDRLGKIATSLTLLGETDLFQSVQTFARNIDFDAKWVKTSLKI